MRLGLYGLPAAGKTYILDRINGIKVFHGSDMLFDINKDFYHMDETVSYTHLTLPTKLEV